MMFKGEIFLNFWLSALIYNPLEAFILIYFCSIFAEIKIDKNIIKHCYIFGFISLLIQYIGKFVENNTYAFIYNIFVALVASPILLYIYIKLIFFKQINFVICIYSAIFNFITLYIALLIINAFKNITVFNVDRSFSYEFFVNLLIKIIQLFIFLQFKKGVGFMKKILKLIAFKNTEKAFTIMEHYNPKMPKILKEKLEKNK